MQSISMTTWSVRAILAGRKTQTRRPAKPGRGPVAHAGEFVWIRETFRVSPFGRTVYRADTPDDRWPMHRWTTSRFLPRRRARLWLELTEEPRLELVPEISAADAIAEGIELPSDMLTLWSIAGSGDGQVAAAALDSFRILWDSIYAKDGHGWEQRPQVWRYAFKKVLTIGSRE